MTIHEFGKEHQTAVVLIRHSVVMWDSFECVVPLLGERVCSCQSVEQTNPPERKEK